MYNMAVWHRPVTTILCTYTSSTNEAHTGTYRHIYTVLSSLAHAIHISYSVSLCDVYVIFSLSLSFPLCALYIYIIYIYIYYIQLNIHHTYTYVHMHIYPDFRREVHAIMSTDDLNTAVIEYNNELINYWKISTISRKIGRQSRVTKTRT